MLMLLLCWTLFPGDDPAVYGAEVSEKSPLITIEALMANPEAYLDKVVRVEGEVQEVCPMAGCWLDMTDKDKKVRIKVKDGEIVFDKKLVGKRVVAEGTVYKFDLTRDEAVNYFRHLAEERGEEFDESSVTSGTTIYQIGGLGVRVK